MFGMNGTEVVGVVGGAVAVLVLVVMAMVLGKLFLQWRANEAAPVVRADAMVVSSRNRVSRPRGSGVESTYMVTFEEPSGERLALQIREHDIEGLTEGVQGLLTFQGTRYLGFVRHDTIDGQR